MPFARILRSSALMGGAQAITLAGSFLRAKVIALLVGASGVGLVGIFNAFSGNIASFAGWGLGTSGVRLIAGASEESRPAKVASVRRMGWMLSMIGLAIALVLFWPLGIATFASPKYACEMAIVACSVPCIIASAGWTAILQASGKIGSLAKVQIAGALAGLLIGLPAIFFWGTIGVAISAFCASAVPAFALWRAATRESTPSDSPSDFADIRELAKIGGALMIVGWLGQLSAYLVRLGIVRQEGLDAAGYYQAAFAISGSLPGFVFAAMGADFFPRVAAAKDEAEARNITEKQIQACLLLGTPLIMALLTLSKPAMRILYSDRFDAAAPLLSWMTWGVFARLIVWPVGFWLIARGPGRLVILVEGIGSCLATVLPLMLIGKYGLVSTAFSFMVATIIYGLMIMIIFRMRSGGWLGYGAQAWSAAAAAALLAGQWWSGMQSSQFAGALPVFIAGAVCAWIYKRKIQGARPEERS